MKWSKYYIRIVSEHHFYQILHLRFCSVIKKPRVERSKTLFQPLILFFMLNCRFTQFQKLWNESRYKPSLETNAGFSGTFRKIGVFLSYKVSFVQTEKRNVTTRILCETKQELVLL